MTEDQNVRISRRTFLGLGIITAASCIIPGAARASVDNLLEPERRLCLLNLHTKEDIDIAYWKNGDYIPDALHQLNYIFRDHYTGLVNQIDTNLFDFLFAIQQEIQSCEPFHLISGYRSKKTNEWLRKKNRNVSRKSFHIYGKAADIRLPDHSLKILRGAAYKLKGGGVGYYPKSNFVHVDVGRVRFWREDV
ncbi:MAG: hypothetical protein AMK71_01630 [Nitrospira bacterium SG8_35_4]|nr:MAG: hypothetical protein AMK71_01630 [Nitrospira bacterium SG8_35_4]